MVKSPSGNSPKRSTESTESVVRKLFVVLPVEPKETSAIKSFELLKVAIILH
ncbi:MAG: hypothetical protein RLZZ171_2954, partial [Cyanobacteriota bacterium]